MQTGKHQMESLSDVHRTSRKNVRPSDFDAMLPSDFDTTQKHATERFDTTQNMRPSDCDATLVCSLTRLLWFPRLLACLLACLLVCLLVCLLACLLACLLIFNVLLNNVTHAQTEAHTTLPLLGLLLEPKRGRHMQSYRFQNF